MTDRLEVEVSIPCPAWSKAVAKVGEVCRRAAVVAFQAAEANGAPGGGPEGAARAEASLVLADDALVRSLNKEYRGGEGPTNVLSFAGRPSPGAPFGEGAPAHPADAPELLGDVIVAFETASAEAGGAGKNLTDHLCHLIVHGMLHLLGYDHRTEGESEHMECLEVQALSRLGAANPYPDRGEKRP